MQIANFQAYVKQTFKRTDKDTELIQAYNDMIVWVAIQMPHGSYKYQSWISTVIGTPDYPLPTDLIHLIYPIRLLEGTGTNDSGYPLKQISKQEYDILEPNPHRTSPSTGKPSQYTVYSRSILPTPIPDSGSYLLEINWTKRPVAQSVGADLPILGSEWDEILKFGTLERLNAMLELWEESSFWASQYRDQAGDPVGMCRKLFDLEKDREFPAITQIQNNDL